MEMGGRNVGERKRKRRETKNTRKGRCGKEEQAEDEEIIEDE